MLPYLSANRALILFLSTYALANVGLFGLGAAHYADQDLAVQIARGAGLCLNFNGALILVPMLRLSLSRLRRYGIGAALPLERTVEFHRLTGHAMFFFAAVHTAAYVVIYTAREVPLVTSFTGTVAAITGTTLALVFIVLWTLSLSFVRRLGRFELFFVSHHLGASLMIILLLHSPRFWMWATVPCLVYVLDRGIRYARMTRPARVRHIEQLPSDVTMIEVERPLGFEFRAGDYVFACVPLISSFEWHPFSISSPPEQEDTIQFHIRTQGNWTGEVYRLGPVWDAVANDRQMELRSKLSRRQRKYIRKYGGAVPMFMDGPHGTPSSEIFDTQMAVIVCGGIGVTPFASILRSIQARKLAGDRTIRVEKVHFYWVNRDQRAFEWFNAMLVELAKTAHQDLFELKLYVTDPAEGPLPAFTEQGRPDWETELESITWHHPSQQIRVFFCGPVPMGKDVKAACDRRGLRYKYENF